MTDKTKLYADIIYGAYFNDIEKGIDYFKGHHPTWTQVVNMYDPLSLTEKRIIGLK